MTPPVERRTEDLALKDLVKQVHDDVLTMRAELSAHVADEPRRLADAVEAAVSRSLERAFPAGDADGHKRYHEATIAKLEARAAFWKKMAFEVSKYGLLGLLGWLAVTAWTAFLHGPGK